MMLRICKRICAFLIIASLLVTPLLFSPIKAYALNHNLVAGEYYGWVEKEIDYFYDSDKYPFNGFVKQMSDEKNGCYYIFFSFYDERIIGGDDEGIILTFTVSNTQNEYTFSINKNGFTDTDENDMKAVDIAYNFEASAQGGGGRIFAGFELKNKYDRQQHNYIKCEYGAGSDRVTTLFDNEMLDMYVEPTAKTTKHITTKQSKDKNEKTTNKKSQTTDKSSKSDEKIKTTKFKGNGSVTRSVSSKYNSSGEASQELYTQDYDFESEPSTEIDIVESEALQTPENLPQVMSKSAIVTIVLASVIGVVGIALLIIAAVSKTEKAISAEDKATDSTEEKDKK